LSSILFSCQKEPSTNPLPGNPSDIEFGYLFLVETDSIRTVNIKSGTTVMSKENPGYLPNGITFEDSIAYIIGPGMFGAENVYNGIPKFQKGYVTGFLNGYKFKCYPVIKDSIVYITNRSKGDLNCSLYAYNKFNGFKIFDSNISYGVESFTPVLGTPLIIGNNIYVGVSHNNVGNIASVYCFDRFTGSLKWNKKLGSGKISPFLLAKDKQLFTTVRKSSTETIIYSLDPANGDINWKNHMPEILKGPILNDNNIVALTFSDPNDTRFLQLSFINTSNGNVNSSSSKLEAYNSFLTGDGLFYIDSTLKRYSITSNSLVWSVETQGTKFENDSNFGPLRRKTSVPVVTDQFIYIIEEASTDLAFRTIKLLSLFIYNKSDGSLARQLNLLPFINPLDPYVPDLFSIIDKNNNLIYNFKGFN